MEAAVSDEGRNGKLIVFEGIDGAGTTTQAELYGQFLQSQRRLVHLTRQPSDGPVGMMLRLALAGRLKIGAGNQAQAMALLFAADRLDHLAHDVEPLLRDGYVVICDRYDLSSIAYQTATASAAAGSAADFADWVRQLNRFAIRPDAVVVIDVSPEEAQRRRRARFGAAELYEREELQIKLAELYQRAEELVPNDEVIHVDGNRDVETIAAAIREKLQNVVG